MSSTYYVACPVCQVKLSIHAHSRLSGVISCPRCSTKATVAQCYAEYVLSTGSNRINPGLRQVIEPQFSSELEHTQIVQKKGTRLPMAKLYSSKEIYELGLGLNYIGKAPQAHDGILIHLSREDALGTISRSHCILKIEYSPSQGYVYNIMDHSSMNGTILEGKSLKAGVYYALELGQAFVLGGTCRLILK